MKDKVKKALKRAASGFMAVLLAVCLVGTPRAKAVATETALLGSIFGSLLVSMGYSWAANNFDAPTFGEAIYDLIKQCDEEMDTGIQLLLDSHLAGLTAVGNGKLTFSQQWVNLANSFAEWFSERFFTGDTTSVVVANQAGNIPLSDGSLFYLSIWNKSNTTAPVGGTLITENQTYIFSTGTKITCKNDSGFLRLNVYNPDGELWSTQKSVLGDYYWLYEKDGSINLGGFRSTQSTKYIHVASLPVDFFISNPASSLTAQKPQEVHYPAVAEDGSQVYEITVDGVTATDIEGIIQGAVDRILAGTAAIAGSIADVQAGTGEEVANPEIDPYKVGLSSVFPFCIPFDVYNMVTMFVAEPEAPHAEWTFTLPWSGQEYSVGWDLAAFDGVARVCRDMELVLFAVGLAVITYKVIKW